MNHTKAVRIAVEAMNRERQRYAFDANLFKSLGCKGYAHGERSFQRYRDLSEAIDYLNGLPEPNQVELHEEA